MDRSQLVSAFDDRLTEFQETYEWYETDGMLRSLCVVGELLSVTFDAVTAARGMHALKLVTETSPASEIQWSKLDSEVDMAWEGAWAELDAFNDSSYSRIMDRAHDVHAFAFFGILPGWALEHADRGRLDFTDVPAYVTGTVTQLNRFLSLLPKSLDLYGVEEIERTCLAATGRLKIDTNESLSVHELAAVTKVSTKRLQNAIYAKTADAPLPNKSDGLIPVASAQRWLEARGYLPSIWREFIAAKAWEAEGSTAVVTDTVEESEDYFFVPEARDGTIFSPTFCQRRGSGGKPSYTIGAKGDEKTYDDYEAALADLTRMRTARWRRPNENGNFGIVSAERWRRLSRSELFAL